LIPLTAQVSRASLVEAGPAAGQAEELLLREQEVWQQVQALESLVVLMALEGPEQAMRMVLMTKEAGEPLLRVKILAALRVLPSQVEYPPHHHHRRHHHRLQ
jgi:hypothetical protein